MASNRLVLSIALIFASLTPAAVAQSGGGGNTGGAFVNGNFETGDFSGWIQGAGAWTSPSQWPTGVLDAADYVPGGNKYDISYNASTVVQSPAQGDPRTDGNLNPIYNGHATAKVNDEYNNYSVSVISQTVAKYSAPHIYFAWAAVLQGSHGFTDSDNFTLKLTDDTTQETLYQVRYNSADAAQASLFSHSQSDWYYTSWQVQDLDVSTRVGHTFTLLLLASDCPYGGHAGYVYLDGFGSVAPPTGEVVDSSLTLTSLDLGTFTQGSQIKGSLTPVGGVAPFTWSVAGNLPAGGSVQGGTFTGTAGEPGTYSATLIVTDAGNSSAAASIRYTVFGLSAQALPSVIQFSPYQSSVGILGGTAPYTVTATGLPPGMSIDTNGLLQGIARTNGLYTVTVTVVDANGLTFSRVLQLNVVAPLPLRVTPATLSASLMSVYSGNLTATGGAPPYTWTLVSGVVPPGLVLHSSGSITGIPAVAGTNPLVLRATDVTGASATGGITIAVSPAALTILNPAPFANGVVGVNYPQTMFAAAGGTEPYSYAITSGALPGGMSLAASGVLAGTPTSTGSYNFTVTVTDAAGAKATANPSMNIRPYAKDLVLSAGSLVFRQAAGSGGVAPAQNVTVQSTDINIPINYTTSITPATANWLSVPPGGVTPGSIGVSLTPAALLLPGGATPYEATVTVTCVAPSLCAGNSQSFLVALNVAVAPPVLTLSSDLVSFAAPAGSTAGMTQQLWLDNTGGGAVGISSLTCGAAWCSISGTPSFIPSGVPATLNVTANPAGLNNGFYRTTLNIHASTGDYTLPVSLFVTNGTGLSVQPSGIQYSSSEGGVPVGGPNFFYVLASTVSPINWTATVLPGSNWLSVINGSGSSTATVPGTIEFSISPVLAGALAPGAYYGRIRVSPVAGPGAPQDFEVVLNVAPPDTPQLPNPTPQGLLFISSATTPPPAQAVQIATGSTLPAALQASVTTNSGGNWLSLNATAGTAYPGNPFQSLISVDPAGLAPGTYYGGVSYAFAGSAVRTVNVTAIVTAPGSGINGAGATTRLALPHAGGCSPTLMVPAQVGLVNNFSAATAWPTPLTVQVMSDCGTPVTTAQVVATFSNGDSPIAFTLTNIQTGLYTATWTPRHTGAQVSILARATAPGLPAITTTLTGAVTPNSAPVLNQHSTLHVFAPEVGASVGPGTIVQMFGQFLAPATVVAQSVPLPTKLSGTSVLIGGIEAPLYFVSAGQINAQVPFELQANQQYQVIVSANGALTTPDPIQLSAVSPGLAALADGVVIAQHGDGKLVSEDAPARPGEFLVMYTSGLGLTDNPVVTGAGSPGSPLARPKVNTSLTIDGQPADVAFAGLTPGLVGLYQINFKVPSGLPNGDLELVLLQNSLPSNKTILPVLN